MDFILYLFFSCHWIFKSWIYALIYAVVQRKPEYKTENLLVNIFYLCCLKCVIKETCCFRKHRETCSVFSRWMDELASEWYQSVTSIKMVGILHSQDILGLFEENDRLKEWVLFQYFVCKTKTNQLAVFVSMSGMLWKHKSWPTDLLIL